MNRRILPGSTIGILGSGQLGRMFTIAAKRLGYRVHVYSPESDTPTGQVADVEIQADYADLDALAAFARRVDVVTFEFENVPAETASVANLHAPVRPGGRVLQTTQNRVHEKNFLRQARIPVTPFCPIHTFQDLLELDASHFPAVCKTATSGYDGKGQLRVDSPDQVESVWSSWSDQEMIMEKWVDYECELSVVAARGLDGSFTAYSPIVNQHRNHILDLSVTPAGMPKRTEHEAIEIARTILTELEVVGVMCVEFFLTTEGRLLVNELAPRPHNSGHLTLDAHVTCQFEQQVRAICGLPLGAVDQLRPAAMANLLGDLWAHGEPAWTRAVDLPDTKLHLYGKQSPRPGRKMGHLTALADSPEKAAIRVLEARRALSHGRPTPTSAEPSLCGQLD